MTFIQVFWKVKNVRNNFLQYKNFAKSKRCPKYGHFTVP